MQLVKLEIDTHCALVIGTTMSRLPNGPQIPPALQLIYWISNPLNLLDKSARRYGDIFTLRLGHFNPFVMICQPQAIQEILSQDAKQFEEGRGNDILKPIVGTNSLLVLDGDRHKRERKLLMPPFHGESIRSYAQVICQITAQVASQWTQDKLVDVRAAMQDITLEVILHAVFGISDGDRYKQLKPAIAAMLNTFDSPLRSSPLFFSFLQQDWSPWGQFKQRQQKIRALLQAEIDERRARAQMGKDVLSLMILARDESGQPMTDQELQDEMLTLLIAGHETTATALTWSFYWIHKHSEVREKLRQELESMGNNWEPIDVTQLPYLSAVCQETLRIYPVAPVAFPRIPKWPVEVMGYHFEENTLLFPCIYLVHHREDLYPDSHTFKPERFIERQYSACEFLPFGGGSRRCLGQALAMLEMKLVLATVLSNFQLQLADNKPVKAARRGLTIAPASQVRLLVKDKRLQIAPKVTISSV